MTVEERIAVLRTTRRDVLEISGTLKSRVRELIDARDDAPKFSSSLLAALEVVGRLEGLWVALSLELQALELEAPPAPRCEHNVPGGCPEDLPAVSVGRGS